ncbi:MAG: PIN domain-containing protein [Chloroflexaceae bacterium]|nr:PIN domain-containing protein [Chloroflexaceae bacterium]NJL32676.1 PIN domain-containing protein [Chloroflexaceae bacterium]NJO05753.1 PIN domain-containing protein [Chloroflexaceae bacterium]
MRLLFDTNIMLDLFLSRQPWVVEATALWHAAQQGRCTGFVSGITPVNCFYVVRKAGGIPLARQAVSAMLNVVQVCPVDNAVLQAALLLPMRDFEDAVQHAAAVANGLDAIVTRDPKGFQGATLPILEPAAVLQQLGP